MGKQIERMPAVVATNPGLAHAAKWQFLIADMHHRIVYGSAAKGIVSH